MIRDVVVVAHNLRSCHNVGSILRTADGLGVTKVYFTGYTPYPISSKMDLNIISDGSELLKKPTSLLNHNGSDKDILESTQDQRLPHVATKVHSQIKKTALGAENTVPWQHKASIFDVINILSEKNYYICALEQTTTAKTLTKFQSPSKVAIIVGNEVKGLDDAVILACNTSLSIPMKGSKESFNVVQALAIALSYIYFA